MLSLTDIDTLRCRQSTDMVSEAAEMHFLCIKQLPVNLVHEERLAWLMVHMRRCDVFKPASHSIRQLSWELSQLILAVWRVQFPSKPFNHSVSRNTGVIFSVSSRHAASWNVHCKPRARHDSVVVGMMHVMGKDPRGGERSQEEPREAKRTPTSLQQRSKEENSRSEANV